MARYVSYRDGGKTNEEGIARWAAKAFSGNVFTGLQVTQQGSPTIGVTVGTGDIKIDSGNGYDYFGWSDAAFNITLNTADASNPRYDLIVAYIDKAVVSSASSNNPNALVFTKVTGTAAASPTEPNSGAIQTAVGAGNPYAILARVTVAATDTTITNSEITDRRTMVTNSLGSANGGWDASPDTFTYASTLGNREYTITTPGDQTARYSPGMRMRFARGTAPPTQSSDFESSSSQYWSKASPTGISFTDDWSAEVWVKIESYTAAEQYIISKRNTPANGFGFHLASDGRVGIFGGDGVAVDSGLTNQAVPLNKWVHLAGTLDMSGTTATIYIDGISVPVNYTNGSSTSVAQAGDLNIGRRADTSSEYFDGLMSDLRLWNTIRTATQIRDNMNKQLVGNETGLIGYWKFDGNGNDSTANANNLTANASVTATTVDNPMKSTEYGIITKVSYSSPNTTLTIFTGTDYNIPNLTLSSPYYSSQKTPYGFPASPGKWRVEVIYRVEIAVTSPTINVWYPFGQINVPTGNFKIGYEINVRSATASAGVWTQFWSMSTASTSESESRMTGAFLQGNNGGSNVFTGGVAYKDTYKDLSSQTLIYLIGKNDQTVNSLCLHGNYGDCVLFAECAYA